MSLSKQIAKHVRDIYFGENWTNSNFKDKLAEVDWKQATTQVDSYNTIAMLVFHTKLLFSWDYECIERWDT